MNETIQGLKEGTLAGFDKIASAYGIPAEYHEEAKVALSAEFDNLEKSASFGANAFMAGAGGAMSSMKGGLGSRMAAGLGAAAVGATGLLAADAIKGLASMAVDKVGGAFGAASNRSAYDQAFKTAVSNSEILQQDPQKAKRMADTIFGFAPTVAADANVLANILDNSIHGDSIDLQTVKVVTDLEEKLNKMKA